MIFSLFNSFSFIAISHIPTSLQSTHYPSLTLLCPQVYYGVGWKKKYKAPTDWCFAIKHPHLQAKSSKYIKYLCSEDPETLSQWVMGIRIAKVR